MLAEVLIVLCSAAVGPAPSTEYFTRAAVVLITIHLASVLLPRLAFDRLNHKSLWARMASRLVIACFPSDSSGTWYPDQNLCVPKGQAAQGDDKPKRQPIGSTASAPERLHQTRLPAPPSLKRRSMSVLVMQPEEIGVAIHRATPLYVALFVPALTAIDVALALSIAGAATAPESTAVKGVASLCLGWRLVSPIASALATSGDDLARASLQGIASHAVILPRMGQV